ncbi:hypothetical protein MKS88_002987 [Plasmodium brasilianum]|uniref:Uncharacterized protein n=1 Tax=Plasmodium brasilianum TaxID=5824 RepID=A0ACB9YB37_PLABR|nr:hypothetical protein MKS88_002987 [Plasmodium brasilianum]
MKIPNNMNNNYSNNNSSSGNNNNSSSGNNNNSSSRNNSSSGNNNSSGNNSISSINNSSGNIISNKSSSNINSGNNEKYTNTRNNSSSVINSNLNLLIGINNIPNNMSATPKSVMNNNINNIPNSINALTSNLNNMHKMHSNVNKIQSNLNNMRNNMSNIASNIKHPMSNSLNSMVGSINNIPSSMNNIPSSMNNMPSSMNNMPSSMNNMPSSMNNMPSSMNNMPSSMNNMPSSMNNMPSSMNNIPSSMNNIPSSMNNMPSSMNNMPSSMNNMPSSMNNMPSSMNNMPSSMNNMPSSMNNMPSSISNMLRTRGNMPSSMGNLTSSINNKLGSMKHPVSNSNAKVVVNNNDNMPNELNMNKNLKMNSADIANNNNNSSTNNINNSKNNINSSSNRNMNQLINKSSVGLRENVVNNLNYNNNSMNYSMKNNNVDINNKLNNKENRGQSPDNNSEGIIKKRNNKMIINNNMNSSSHFIGLDPVSTNRFFVNDMKNVENNIRPINNKISNMKENQNNMPHIREKYLLNKNEKNNMCISTKKFNNINKANNSGMLNSSGMSNNTGMLNSSGMSNNTGMLNSSGMSNNTGISNITSMSNNNGSINNNSEHPRSLKNVDNSLMYNAYNVNSINTKNINKMYSFNNINSSNNNGINSNSINNNSVNSNSTSNISNNNISNNSSNNNINDTNHFGVQPKKDNKLSSKPKDTDYNGKNKTANVLINEEANFKLYGVNNSGSSNNNISNNINNSNISNNNNNNNIKNISHNNNIIGNEAKKAFIQANNMFDAKTYRNIENFKNINDEKNVRYNNLSEMDNSIKFIPENANLSSSMFHKMSVKKQIMSMKNGGASNSHLANNKLGNINLSVSMSNSSIANNILTNGGLANNVDNAGVYKLSVNNDKESAKDAFNHMSQTNMMKDMLKENNKSKLYAKKYKNSNKILKSLDQQNIKSPKIHRMDRAYINKKININGGSSPSMHINQNMTYEELKKKKNTTAPLDNIGSNSMPYLSGHPSLERNISTPNNFNSVSYINSDIMHSNINNSNDVNISAKDNNINSINRINNINVSNNNNNIKDREKGTLILFDKNMNSELKNNNYKEKKKNFDYNNHLLNFNENNEQNTFTRAPFSTIHTGHNDNEDNYTKEIRKISNLNLNMNIKEDDNYVYNKKKGPLENYDNMNNDLSKVFLDKEKNMYKEIDVGHEDDDLKSSKKKKKYSEVYETLSNYSNERMGSDKKLIALTKLFGNVIDEDDHANNNENNSVSNNVSNNVNNNDNNNDNNNESTKISSPSLRNHHVRSVNRFDLEYYKSMSLDTLLNNLNLDKEILNILKDKINNINRNINVTIRSSPMEKQVECVEKENFNLPSLIHMFDEFINWCENNLSQIKLQLYNVAFCLLLEIYILLLTSSYDTLVQFKNKYLKKFSAYEPVTKFLSNCVSLSQMFEISLIRFKEKDAKHIVYMTKLGKKSLLHYLSVYGGVSLYNLITTKIKIIQVDDSERNFNFFYSFVSTNFVYNIKLSFPVQWNLPPIYSLKDEIAEDDNSKLVKEKEENAYVPNETSDAYYYYKHIIRTQVRNRLKVTKNRMPSMLYYCLNNCNDMTCAEISGFDGSLVATAHTNNIIKLWNIKQSQINKIKNKKRDMENSSIVDPSDIRKYDHLKEINTISIDLDDQEENEISKLYGNIFNVSSLCFGETNKILLSGNVNGDIYLYSTISNKNYVKYVGGHTPIWYLDTAFLGYFFCSCEDDGNLRIYSTNKTYPFITYKYNSTANICKYHYNSTLVACGYFDNYVHLYDVRVNSFIKRFKNNYPSSQGVTSLCFSKNGKLLSYAGGYTNNINLIDLATDKYINVESKNTIGTNQLEDTPYFHTTKSFDSYIDNNFLNKEYAKKENGKSKTISSIDYYEDKILNMDFSYDNNLLVSMSSNSLIDFYNCSKASKETKSSVENKRIKLEKSPKKNNPYVKLSKSYGVNYSNLISAKFTPENALLLFGINALI